MSGSNNLEAAFLPIQKSLADKIPVGVNTAAMLLGMNERVIRQYVANGHMPTMVAGSIKFSLSYILSTNKQEIVDNARNGITFN